MNTKTTFLLFLTLGDLWLASCTNQATNEPGENISIQPVPVTAVRSLDTVIYNDYIADIHAVRNIEVRSKLKGFLEKIYVDEGSEVRRGQPLFKISDTEYVSEVSRAEATLNNAIANAKTIALEVDRTRLLVDKKIVSETDLEVIKAQLSAAESSVDEARSLLQHAKTQLSYTTIRSPFDGKIGRIPLKEGSLLDEGALLTVVADLSAVYAYFEITEREYLSYIDEGNRNTVDFDMPVNLVLANGAPYQHAGKAEFAENQFEETTGTIALRARFPNPEGLLMHGATGKISVPVSTGNTLVVHQKAVFEIQDRTYVYRVSDDNVISMTPFTAGRRIGHYYLVEDGLSASDRIVFEGVLNLRDGMAIEPVTVDPDNRIAQANR